MKSIEDKFWDRVTRSDNYCWSWIGSIRSDGYGVLELMSKGVRRRYRAHRLSYELWHGETIPEEMTIDHLCRNKRCVNPEHLEVVTLEENVRRQAEAVTHCPAGHEYNSENTRFYGPNKKYRKCKVCHRQWEQERKSSVDIWINEGGKVNKEEESA